MIWLSLFLIGTVIYYIYTDIQLMKKGLDSIPRADIYRSMLTTQWTIVAILLALWWMLDIDFADLYKIHADSDIQFLIENKQMFMGVLTGAAVGLVIIPLLMLKSKNTAAFDKIDFMLPKTIGQRVVFFFIAVTAGVSEELLFRGAATYLLMNIGIDMPMWVVGVIGAILFGLAHWYQGLSGIIMTGWMGFALFNIYVETGSLLIPIVLHFLMDVKFVFMPNLKKKKGIENTECQAQSVNNL